MWDNFHNFHMLYFFHIDIWVIVEIAGIESLCPSFDNNSLGAKCFCLVLAWPNQAEEMSVSMTGRRAVYTLHYVFESIEYMLLVFRVGVKTKCGKYGSAWNSHNSTLEAKWRPVCERAVTQEELVTHLMSFRIHKTSLSATPTSLRIIVNSRK